MSKSSTTKPKTEDVLARAIREAIAAAPRLDEDTRAEAARLLSKAAGK